VGNGKVVSVEENDLITKEMEQMLRLNLDIKPTGLLVGDEENPVEFEWSAEVTLLSRKALFSMYRKLYKNSEKANI
jgi:hypothetical protein